MAIMTVLKIVFCVLLCVPLGWVMVNLFNKIADELTSKKQ